MTKMRTVKCEICSREADSLFIVSHKERGTNKDMRALSEARRKKPPSSEKAAVAAEEDHSMACVPKEAVNRMTRLIGDADKAECKVNKIRSITNKIDDKEIEGGG